MVQHCNLPSRYPKALCYKVSCSFGVCLAYPRKHRGVHVVHICFPYIFLLRAHGPIIELARVALNARRRSVYHIGVGSGIKKKKKGDPSRKGSNSRVSVYAPVGCREGRERGKGPPFVAVEERSPHGPS